MVKLIFMTLLAFTAVLMIFGEGDGRKPVQPPPRPVAAAPEPEPGPAPEAEPAPEAPTEPVAQTPERQRQFPGPALRPSPEYAGQEPPPPAEDLADAGTDRLYVTGNSVNFRAGPTTSDAVVGRLTRGQAVTAVSAPTGDWVHIRDAEGRTGYMSAQFLSSSRP
ncbi:MAG: SH3 domain-containing protein [Paracoccus sp. (in: a-proteobacteria)]|nr:SH3 domain-containing protein [Paracoccus sp. (in: a-proteobacteria)]